jgi:hypothetical protein
VAEVRISLTTIPPLKPLLDAVVAVTKQWTDMSRCYIGNEEAVQLAELLDTLTDVARDLGAKGERGR